MELLGEEGASWVWGLRREPRGVVGIEVACNYCVGQGIEVVELERKVRGSRRCWGNVNVDDVELLFV